MKIEDIDFSIFEGKTEEEINDLLNGEYRKVALELSGILTDMGIFKGPWNRVLHARWSLDTAAIAELQSHSESIRKSLHDSLEIMLENLNHETKYIERK